MSQANATDVRERRFVLIDALRAFAAIWVAFHHFYDRNLVESGHPPLPQPFHSLFREGWLGVSVFFVLSGFVITHSLRGAQINPRYVGRFALRRSLRLDPPYWFAIVAMVVLNLVSSAITHEVAEPPPSFASVLTHMLYAQRFFGHTHIVGVFWTLCYEIQFYLILVACLGLAARFGRVMVFAPLWIFSMAWALGIISVPEPFDMAFCFSRWPLFFLGVVVYWAAIERTLSVPLAVLLGIATLVPLALQNDHKWVLEVCVAFGTAALLLVASLRGFISTLSFGSAVQFLGKISYSIYLLHMVVGSRGLRLAVRLLPARLNAWQECLAIGVGLAVTIIAAYISFRLIEQPAHNLSRRITMDTKLPLWRPKPDKTREVART